MRQFHPIPILLTALSAFLFTGCIVEDTDSPIEGCLLFELAPASQPVQYEVLITGLLISGETLVYFDEEEANTRFVPGYGLIATVPGGLSGEVGIRVLEGDCLGRTDFEVLSRFPAGIPASPSSHVVPTPPPSLPPTLAGSWRNAFDPQHHLRLVDMNGDGIFDFDREAPLEASFETHEEDAALGSEEANPLGGAYDSGLNTVELTAYRSANGGEDETYDGQLVDPAPFDRDAVAALLLVSRLSGRQLLLLSF